MTGANVLQFLALLLLLMGGYFLYMFFSVADAPPSRLLLGTGICLMAVSTFVISRVIFGKKSGDKES